MTVSNIITRLVPVMLSMSLVACINQGTPILPPTRPSVVPTQTSVPSSPSPIASASATETAMLATNTPAMEASTLTPALSNDPLSELAVGDYILIAEQGQFGPTDIELVPISQKTVIPVSQLPGTPVDIVASRDGQFVAYNPGAAINIKNMRTGEIERIANTGDCAFIDLRLGHGVTASCNEGESQNIFSFENADSERVPVFGPIPGLELRQNGRWSADGTYLLYISLPPPPVQDAQRSLALLGGNCTEPCVQRSISDTELLTSMAWSWGLLYALGLSNTAEQHASVVIASAEAGNLVSEYPLDFVSDPWVTSMAWAPDDTQIAFAIDGRDIYLLDLPTGTFTQLFEGQNGVSIYVLAWLRSSVP